MRNLSVVLAVFLFLVFSSANANANYLFGGRAAGMGNAAVTLYDFWAVSHNQAGLARMEHIVAGVYFENRYRLKELSLGAGAIVMPTQSGVFGFNFNYFGFELFNESKIGLAYARTFGDRFSAGIQLNYNNLYIAEDHGRRGNFTVEMGAIFHILPQLSIGAHIYNPTRAKLAEFADERIPTIFRTGLAYQFSDKVMVSIETEKSIYYTAVFKAGIEYHVSKPIYLRGGIGTNPTTNAFGFGMVLGNLKIDLATSFHHVLGYSPQLSIIYEFK